MDYNKNGDTMETKLEEEFLECEKHWIFLALIFVGGYFGAYTYVLKGGIFCNAQTANMVLFGMALGTKNFMRALYLLVPFSAYFLGTMLSEYTALSIKRLGWLRWDTVFIFIEIIAVIIMGFLPISTPDQVFQITINFICAMQFNTFRQAESIPMATTFVTNHIRQTGSFLVRWLRKKEERQYLNRSLRHLSMLVSFILGAIVSTILCDVLKEKAILCILVVLIVIFIDFVIADRITEKELLLKTPKGH